MKKCFSLKIIICCLSFFAPFASWSQPFTSIQLPPNKVDIKKTNEVLNNLTETSTANFENLVQTGALKVDYDKIDRALEKEFQGDEQAIQVNKEAMRPLGLKLLLRFVNEVFAEKGLKNIRHAFLLKDLKDSQIITQYFAKQNPHIDLESIPIIISDLENHEGGQAVFSDQVAPEEWPVTWSNERGEKVFLPGKVGIRYNDVNLLPRTILSDLFGNATVIVISSKFLRLSANYFYLTLVHEIKHVVDYKTNPTFAKSRDYSQLRYQFDELERNNTWYSYFKKSAIKDPRFSSAAKKAVANKEVKSEEDFYRLQFEHNMNRGLREALWSDYQHYETPHEVSAYSEMFRFGYSLGMSRQQLIDIQMEQTANDPVDTGGVSLYRLDFLNRMADEATTSK